MDDIATLKATIRKLSSRATAAKMNLHDLAEDLPVGWTGIPDVAKAAHDAFAALDAARQALAKLENPDG